MTGIQFLLLVVVFFLTSAVSIVTGSTSLITVPAMFALGIEPRTAVATNMFALTFMSIGGSLPFLRGDSIDRKRIVRLIVLTLAGSAAGAFLLLIVPQSSVPAVVSTAMIGVAIFSLVYRKAGTQQAAAMSSPGAEIAGYALTFLLGIYGGFFSGGYVTILTAVYVVFFRMTFLEAIATTKLINVFSSGIATIVFMGHGLVDYRLGSVLAVAMFAGAWGGGHFAQKLGDRWLRPIFLTAVWALGLKTLFYDLMAHNVSCHRTAE
jgi:uncharacterized membrane protein YfcA